ncbi:MAG: cation-transporting P-type ATPase, partial [Propionibacteriaceae bacterium]|nr:cation-transporting P-type ATPase [Propionibacteriaceae bacterium]
MNKVRTWLNSHWAVPTISGLLILASLTASRVFDSSAWGDGLMIAAAIIAGTRVVIKAWRALTAKVIGIDLLVSVAAIGAIAVRNYWEAAA